MVDEIRDETGEVRSTDRRELDTKFRLETLKGKYPFGQLCINERVTLKLI